MNSVLNARHPTQRARLPQPSVMDCSTDQYPCPNNSEIGHLLGGMFERLLAEERTLQTKGLLQNAINALPVEIAILNRDGDVVDWNRACAQFVAKHNRGSADGIAGTSYLALLHMLGNKFLVRKIAKRLTAFLAGGEKTLCIDYQFRTGSENRSFRLTGARFSWNREVRIVVANEDITELRNRGPAASELSERQIALQEEERQRIAKELHDSTAQNLVAIGLNLMLLRGQGPADAASTKIWNDTECCLAEVLKEIRTITYLLYSPRLQSEGLRLSLHRFIEGFGTRTGLITRSRISRDVDHMPLPAQRSALRIVQEALSNVHRHARATQVSIDLRVFSGRMHVAIVDNGCGISGMLGEVETDTFRPGVGIPGMRARMRELGGNLKIVSCAKGTRIYAAIPAPAP